MHRGGAGFGDFAGLHAVSAIARRSDSQGPDGHSADIRCAIAADRSRPTYSWICVYPVLCARLASFSSGWGARIRYDWCGRALLDRDRMAEWHAGHRLRFDRRYAVRAEGRSGLCLGDELHGRSRAIRRFGGDRGLCGAARRGDLCRLQPRDWPCPGACWRADGSALANGNVHSGDSEFYPAARSDEPDELRHSAIL